MKLLEQVTDSKKLAFTDLKILLYGSPAVGKSSFASHPDFAPIYIDLEDGLHAIKAPRFPRAKTYEDIKDQIAELKTTRHDYKTVVIDSIDWLEKLVEERVCKDYSAKTLMDVSFGRGYSACRTYIAEILTLLDELPMMIIFIAHEKIQTVQSPLYDPYDKIQPKLNDKISSLFAEYCDVVGYMTYRLTVKKGQGFEKSKALGSGERVLYLNEKPSFLAKNRFGLPDKIEPKLRTLISKINESIESSKEDLPDWM